MKMRVQDFVCLFGVLLVAGATVPATQGASVGATTLRVKPPVGQPGGRPQGTYYAGESLHVGQRDIPLFRSRDKVAVLQAPGQGVTAAAVPDEVRVGERSYRMDRWISKSRTTVLTTQEFRSRGEQADAMRQLQAQAALGEVVPVYIHRDSGLEVIPTGNIIVGLAGGYSQDSIDTILQQMGGQIERSIRGTTDQYVLSIEHSAAEELFTLCDALRADPAIEWAEPEFTGQVIRYAVSPDDPLFESDQWHLKAINAPEAWEVVTGSRNVIIAVLDDGIEYQHEDLRDALPSNDREIAGDARDNDLNGWQDDCNGWDFYDNDNDPSPSDSDENHGTQVAGVAVATGNNGKGGVGVAYGCRLMPLKVLKTGAEGTRSDVFFPNVAEALYYAAGRTANGRGTWRGADIISISLGFSETNVVDAALAYATRQGRAGKGCPVFCASGNDALGWLGAGVSFGEKGTHDFRWEYIKDTTGSDGLDTCWLDAVSWPDGSAEMFNTEVLPSGWTTGGDAHWMSVQDQVEGNHALVETDPNDVRAVRAGPIRDRGRSHLATRKTIDAGDMYFWLWPSMEESYPIQVGWYDWVDWSLSYSIWPFSSMYGLANRMQFILPREDLGWDEYAPLPVRQLRYAEFYLIDSPAQRLSTLKIRMKQVPAGQDTYYSATWDQAGWTTVFDGTNVPLNTGTSFDLGDATSANLVRFDFSRPFTYDPNYNLAVDISCTAPTWTYGGLCLLWVTEQVGTVVGLDLIGGTDPTRWPGLDAYTFTMTVPLAPLMWLGSGDEVQFFVDWLLTGKFSGIRTENLVVSYPATSPYAIAVGASTDLGTRAYYSQCGPKLDFVAPSNGGDEGITTTDRTGKAGADPGNYSHTFGGTSSATPLAAGVAGLLLSKDPSLTAEQVRTVMRQTCSKIGETPYVDGRNDYYGYGQIDAAAAVNAIGD